MIFTCLVLTASSVLPTSLSQEFHASRLTDGEGSMPYRWIAPETIEEGHRYPLILFLHGAGERGSDNELQLKHFPSRMLSAARRAEFPCFILAPQCPENERWSADTWGEAAPEPLASQMTEPMNSAALILRDFVARHPVDTVSYTHLTLPTICSV